jgi:hypothetical protein
VTGQEAPGVRTADTLSITDVALTLDLNERTLRRWVNRGWVPTEPDPSGGRGRVTRAADLDQVAALKNRTYGGCPDSDRTASGQRVRTVTVVSGHGGPDSDRTPDSSPLNTPRHDVSPGAAGPIFPQENVHRAELAEQRAALLESELVRSRDDVQQLRAQLERRDEEINRRAIAEEQLRVMLMKLDATNAELAGALVQKALPPAPEPVRKARWWQLWK